MSILIKPIITEKATRDSELLNRYGFEVSPKANKVQIKKEVEATYSVTVLKVVLVKRHSYSLKMVKPLIFIVIYN
jgi:ribosomal protein L23